MEFLYSLNRLNVATSRARCASILVASPRLFEPECKSPRQMQLANALCRYVELAAPVVLTSMRDYGPSAPLTDHVGGSADVGPLHLLPGR